LANVIVDEEDPHLAHVDREHGSNQVWKPDGTKEEWHFL
jgi:hypothetical protein